MGALINSGNPRYFKVLKSLSLRDFVKLPEWHLRFESVGIGKKSEFMPVGDVAQVAYYINSESRIQTRDIDTLSFRRDWKRN